MLHIAAMEAAGVHEYIHMRIPWDWVWRTAAGVHALPRSYTASGHP